MIEAFREQWAMLVIALGALFGAWTLFTHPAMQDHDAAEARLASAISARDGGVSGPVHAEPIDNAARIEWLLGLRFGKPTLIGEQDRLHEIAGETGVRIARIDPGTRSEDLGFGRFMLRGSTLQVEASGGYDAISRFLSQLGNSQACVVEDFSIRNSGQGEDMSVSLRLRTARVVPRNGAVAEGGLFE